jgi:uncharacterized protein (DUF2236 family)
METRVNRTHAEVDMHAPESLTIRYAGDIRTLILSGRTFLMQVAHPSVGAGVNEFSSFREDPLRRLREVARSGDNFMFSGRKAAEREGQRLRAMHRNIQGRDGSGKPYHSLDPEVYGWVHTVFFDTAVTMHELFGTPLSRSDQEQLFGEWRQGGALLGLRDQDMPADVDAYWTFYDEMIETKLEYNAVTRHILNAPVLRVGPLQRIPDNLWTRLMAPIGTASRRLTLGSLPPRYRKKIAAHEPWTSEDEQWLQRFRSAVKAVVPRLPLRLRVTRKAYRAMQRARASSGLD